MPLPRPLLAAGAALTGTLRSMTTVRPLLPRTVVRWIRARGGGGSTAPGWGRFGRRLEGDAVALAFGGDDQRVTGTDPRPRRQPIYLTQAAG